MLKPYRRRVQATYALMQSFIEFTSVNSAKILALRKDTKTKQVTQARFPIAWKWDKSRYEDVLFKGYEAAQKQSEVSGLQRLFYDRSKAIELKIPFYNVYVDTLSVVKPTAYIIPQGWWKVIERLKANGVQMQQLKKDTSLEVEVYKIESYQSSPRPFEGHHLNTNVRTSKTIKKMRFRTGDYYIPLKGAANRFLIETLEPQAQDSYFAWNFFDPILGQKEGFSDYVFEERATEFLKQNPVVRAKLEERKRSDSAFAKNGQAQLNFVYQNSPYFEPAFMEYPVYRLM
jgi:hypothetical protein